MAQKLGFPYFGLSLNTLIFFVGLILSFLTFLVFNLVQPPPLTATAQAIIGVLAFAGVFLTGWSLLGYAVSKDMTEGQRFIAFFFALLVLVGIFAVYFGHAVGVTFSVT